MSNVPYEKITVANVSDLKPDDEIFSLNSGTGVYEKVKYESAIGSKYSEILEEKAKIDRVKADELGKAKEQDKTRQSNYDATGPIGAPQAVAFVLAQPLPNNPNKYQYNLTFFKLYKKQIDTNTGSQRSYMENGSSGVETKFTWGYVALFSTMRIFNDANADIVARFVTSQFLEYGDSKTFNAEEFFNRAASSRSSFNSIGTPIGLLSFDMQDDITSMQLLSKYENTNLKDGKWVIPVKLYNPKCIHVRRDNCRLISGYTVAPNQNATDQKAIDTLKNDIATSVACKNALSRAIDEAENNNKSSWFTFKKTRMAKIKAQLNAALASMQDCVNRADVNISTDTIPDIQNKFAKTHARLSEQLSTNSTQQTPTQIQLVYYDGKFTNNPNTVFFIDPAPDMTLGNLVLLVANACKSTVGGKRTLRKGRSHQFKKTKNKKYKKHGTSRRGQRHKYSMRRKRIH
jgi:hypothetical protein